MVIYALARFNWFQDSAFIKGHVGITGVPLRGVRRGQAGRKVAAPQGERNTRYISEVREEHVGKERYWGEKSKK